jgi:chorismate mutase-like protein
MDKAAPDPLQAIRNRIDEIDERVHRLLIERSGVIAELIRIKGVSKSGAAFRPDREADMMRRLAARHAGGLPLPTVEHIWREVITAFTAMQAPFAVAVAPADDPLAFRDLIRFNFGFAVPLEACASAAAAVARVRQSQNDVAVIPVAAGGRWWDGLAGTRAPHIFARLPFIELHDHPAAVPAYVVGPPLKEPLRPDIRVVAVADRPDLDAALGPLGGRIVARAEGEALAELPAAADLSALGSAGGLPVGAMRELGGFYAPVRADGEAPAEGGAGTP